MSKLYSYISKVGLKSDKFYSSKEKMMEKLQEDWDEMGGAMLIEDAIKEKLITISEFEAD